MKDKRIGVSRYLRREWKLYPMNKQVNIPALSYGNSILRVYKLKLIYAIDK